MVLPCALCCIALCVCVCIDYVYVVFASKDVGSALVVGVVVVCFSVVIQFP